MARTDDPIFDPWSVVDDELPSPRRWRARPGTAPAASIPRLVPSERPSPTQPEAGQRDEWVPGGRPAGAAAFLRSKAVRRLWEMAQHLRMAHHEASVEDLLGDPRPMLRLEVRPWHGPYARSVRSNASRLEITIEEEPSQEIVVRTWVDQGAGTPTSEARIAADKVGVPWMERLALDFVRAVLDRI